MRRRAFIAALGGAATLSLSASLRLNAQSGGVPRVGVLMGIAADDPEAVLPDRQLGAISGSGRQERSVAFDDYSIVNPLALIIGAQRSVSARIR
jgi:hypothetical protein